MDVPVGRVTYTPILNTRGGYESDVVALRIRDDAYLIVTGSAQQTRDMDLLRRHIAADEFVTLTDLTSAYAVIGVMGPNSRTLLSRLSPDDFTNEGFPYLTHREVEIGDTVARASRISYVGELGWELYVPSEAALPLYDRIREAGSDLGIENAGSFAMAGLRIEKGYCAWGHDIGPDDTPLQAGMGFATKLSGNTDFTGRAALERKKIDGVGRRRILLSVDDPDVILMGLEPILVDGEILGYTTSAAYGHTVGRSVAIGYIQLGGSSIEDIVANGRFEVEAALTRHSATTSLKPLHDPTGSRLRG
jgi:glycine cleavage system aminomethyltransferase T